AVRRTADCKDWTRVASVNRRSLLKKPGAPAGHQPAATYFPHQFQVGPSGCIDQGAAEIVIEAQPGGKPSVISRATPPASRADVQPPSPWGRRAGWPCPLPWRALVGAVGRAVCAQACPLAAPRATQHCGKKATEFSHAPGRHGSALQLLSPLSTGLGIDMMLL